METCSTLPSDLDRGVGRRIGVSVHRRAQIPPPHAPFTIAATATDVSAARGSSTATRSCASALPEDFRTFFPAFLARLAHTEAMASLA